MPPPQKKKLLEIRPPSGAKLWTLARSHRETKGKSKHTRYEPCKWPDPLPDGGVVELFPAEQFSKDLVLRTWGPGRYRLEWYDANGEHLQGHGCAFEVQQRAGAELPAAGKRRRRAGGDDAGDEVQEFGGVPVRKDGAINLLDVLTLMQARDERAERREEQRIERMREEQRQQRESDRVFMQTLLQISAGGGGGGARVDMNAIARETQLALREQMVQLREDLGLQRAQLREDEANRGDPEEDPGQRLLGVLVDELEEQLPGAVQEAIPAVIDMFKARGYRPGPAIQGVVNHLAGNGRANGV